MLRPQMTSPAITSGRTSAGNKCGARGSLAESARVTDDTVSKTTESVTMATFQLPARRLILAGGFAVAVVAAPVISLFAVPTAETLAPPVAACTPGEEMDVYTTVCSPMLVPNSPFGTMPGDPQIPTVEGIPCVGASAGTCRGLAQEAEDEGPPPIPQSTISASP